ncbi:hypothetical protein NL108_017991 [Boleophthalmus pectinirostris]|uniref:uncharacterized protein LOC110161145 isoform X1 n=1 Tax=Boleophthalmus pectinirostris TaxID=150288 RepID=UPI0024323CEA|nr:uncharacterized protein LOC110161145 isoform X1 [Boleophthalmus pectinirostris]KAJ0058622.1 hypothetical protein NL108_017991 [Boleophthalmus pectinirostris]
MPKIHPETKALIIKRLKTRSTAEVADTFNVSQRQVQRIRKRSEMTGDVFDKPRSGRPRKTTAREDRLLIQKSKASPFSTAAELHQAWSPQVPVSTRTVCRILSRNGLHGQISAQKPALNKRQLKNRVAFAKAHSLLKGWTLEKWQKVDFSDESSVELHHRCRKYCRRPTGARMDPRFTQKTWSEEPVVIPTKRSVGTQLSAGTLRYHRSKGIQATDKSIRKGTSILEQIGQIQSSAAVNRANHESDKGPAAKRICVKEEEEEEHISDPLLPHNSMYEPRDSDASDQSDLESEYGDAKYIVSASSLRELFERCPICTKHCKVKRRRRGLLLSFSQTCPHCSYRRRWQSQMEELLEVPVTEDQSENENSDCENPSKEILAAHVFINQRGSYQNQNRLGQNTTEYSP